MKSLDEVRAELFRLWKEAEHQENKHRQETLKAVYALSTHVAEIAQKLHKIQNPERAPTWPRFGRN